MNKDYIEEPEVLNEEPEVLNEEPENIDMIAVQELFEKVNKALSIMDYCYMRSGEGVADATNMLNECEDQIKNLTQEQIEQLNEMQNCDAKRYILEHHETSNKKKTRETSMEK